MATTDDNAALVEEARRGSERAFTELVRLYHPLLRSFLFRFLHRAGDGIDDLAQQVFLVAYRQLPTLRGKFSSWLLGIARNEALTYLRSESRRRRREQFAARAFIVEGQIARLEDEQSAEDHEQTLAAMHACLDHLPPHSREVVDRFYFARQSTADIAAEINKTSGSVRMTLMRIRRALQTCITDRLKREEYH